MSFVISSEEVRSIFLGFFEKNDHLIIPNSSLIPQNDPTLLFINSGMAPLKEYFTEEKFPPAPNLCNIQPCVRTIDIADVGDRHHLTLFEMMGSWSINNYFKQRAIELAYDLLVNHFKFPKEKLFVTVYEGSKQHQLAADTESYEIWKSVGMDESHIIMQPHEDNFWGPAGSVGPCGPCTEVFFDSGDDFGPSYEESGTFDTQKRYIEIWNAGVFMEFFKNENNTYSPLKIKSVDTGSGLERMTMVLNGLETVYETDLMLPILQNVNDQLGNHAVDTRTLRVLTDHIKASAFILSEGVSPSNEGRGYVLRRLMRRCLGLLAKQNIHGFDYADVVGSVVDQFEPFYDQFTAKKDSIISRFDAEVNAFNKVIVEGVKRVETVIKKYDKTQIDGADVFDLVSTYGMPIEFIEELLLQHKKTINKPQYEAALKAHQEVSKQQKTTTNSGEQVDFSSFVSDLSETNFSGYESTQCSGTVIKIINNNQSVRTAKASDKVFIVTDQTCFYAESGGQVGDTGTFNNDDVDIQVTDTQKVNGVFIHAGVIRSGRLECDTKLNGQVDYKRRELIKKNHSATHLLQSALQTVCGDSIKQEGSLVDEEKLRFDFCYDQKLTEDQLNKIEQLVNQYIQENSESKIEYVSLESAIKAGAKAFFKDKYGDQVRVVTLSDKSKELCGGLHVTNTSEIGLFRLISESSISRGTRRIIAITGQKSLEYTLNRDHVLKQVCQSLKTKPEQLLQKVTDLSKRKVEKSSQQINVSQDEIKQTKKNIQYLVKDCQSGVNIKDETIRLAQKISGVACIYRLDDTKITVSVGVEKLQSDKIDANQLLKEIMKPFNGRGGGKPSIASGGGVVESGNVDNLVKQLPDLIDSYIN